MQFRGMRPPSIPKRRSWTSMVGLGKSVPDTWSIWENIPNSEPEIDRLYKKYILGSVSQPNLPSEIDNIIHPPPCLVVYRASLLRCLLCFVWTYITLLTHGSAGIMQGLRFKMKYRVTVISKSLENGSILLLYKSTSRSRMEYGTFYWYIE